MGGLSSYAAGFSADVIFTNYLMTEQ